MPNECRLLCNDSIHFFFSEILDGVLSRDVSVCLNQKGFLVNCMLLDEIVANIEQILLNDAGIILMRAGYGTQTRSIGESLRDDTEESIAQLAKWNESLREANAILIAAYPL